MKICREALEDAHDVADARWQTTRFLAKMQDDVIIHLDSTPRVRTTFELPVKRNTVRILENVQSLKQLWVEVEKISQAEEPEHKSFSIQDWHHRDAWGRPYHYKRSIANNETALRVTSAGANGKMEDGRGDDIYMEVTFDSQGKVLFHFQSWIE